MARVTIEPFIFLAIFGWSAMNGAQVRTKLLISKICEIELGYEELVCQNISSNATIESEVQIKVNEFEMVSDWLSKGPGVLYSFFAGSLSDDYGRKPCLFLPVFGALIGTIFDFINYTWIKTLPTEFFYISGGFWYFILGGNAVYYLGTYGYGASITTNEERAKVLGRFDAIELAGWVLGSLVSPSIFQYLNYYGSYSIYLICCILSLIYLHYYVPETTVKPKRETMHKKSCMQLFKEIFVDSSVQMVKTLFKKRPGIIRTLLFIQLIGYCLLWFNYQYEILEYLYMTKVLNGFVESNYSYYYAAKQTVQGLFIILIMPRLKIHPSLFCIIALLLQTLSYFMLPWLKEVWMYYGAQILMLAYYGSWASARTLFTFCVNEDEIGKIYASVGIVGSIAPLLSNPAYRTLYNSTIDSFPGAILLLAGSINIVIVFIFYIVFVKRSNFDLIEANTNGANMNEQTSEENIEIK